MAGRGAVAGLVVVAANVAAVVVLAGGLGSAYRVDELANWQAQVMGNPGRSDLASLLFVVGVLALIPFGAEVTRGRSGGAARAARAAFYSAAVLNTLGPLLVVAVSRAIVSDAAFWLQRAIDLDAAFNLALALGLLGLARDAHVRGAPRALVAMTAVAGLATLPVSLQFFSGAAARFLAVAGPLWLAAILGWTIRLARLWRAAKP